MTSSPASTGFSWPPVARWAGAVLLAFIIALLVVRVALLTPLASSLLENTLDGLSVGEGMTLNAHGVRGDLLGRVSVAELSVSDAEGVWLTLEDVRLHWNPLTAVGGHVVVRELSAASMDVARKPIATASSSDAPRTSIVWPAGWSLTVDHAGVGAIQLAEGVAGPAAAFTFDASADVDAGSLQAAEVTFARADALGDILFATAGRNDAERLVGSVQLEAAAGGPLAAMLKTPDSAWSFAAGIQDTGENASGQGRLTIDGADVLVFDGRVDDGGVEMSGYFDVAAAPYTRDLTDRLGSRINMRVRTEIDGGGASRLTINADSDALAASFIAPADERALDIHTGELSVSVVSPAALLGWHGMEAGPLQVVGEVTRDEGVAFSGVATLSAPAVHGASATQLVGPISAQFKEGEVAIGATIAASDLAAAETIANVLGATPNFSVDARFDTQKQVAGIDSLRLAGEHLELSLDGEIDLASGAIGLNGAGELATIGPALPGATGVIALTTELSRSNREEPANLTIELQGENVGFGDTQLAELIGANPQLVANAAITPDGAGLGEVRVRLAQASLEAVGDVDAEGALTIDIDGAATGVVPSGPVEIAGATALGAELRGSLESPTLRLEARVDHISADDHAIDDARLRVEAEDLLDKPFGRVRLDGAYGGEVGSLSSAFDVRDSRLSLSAIDGRWRDVSLSGDVAAGGGRSPVVAINAGDARGAVTLSVDVLNHEGGGYVLIEGDARDASFGDQIALQSGALRAEGRFDEIDFQVEAVGDGLAPFDIAITGGVSLGDDNSGSVYLNPHGQFGGADIQTIQPLGASWGDGRVTVAGMLAASGGRLELDGDYSATDGLRADIAWADLPLSLLDALRDDRRLAGRLHGGLSLTGADVVTGRADATLTDARLAGALPSSGIDSVLTAELLPGAIMFDLQADDKAGLNATVSGAWPVKLAATPFAASVPPNEPVSVNINVEGPIDGLWSVVGSETIDVAGALKVQIAVAGSHNNPVVSGEAALTDGRVEDTVIGLRLLDVGANAAFNGESIVVSNVTGHDGVGGRATGSGDMRLERANAPSGEVRIALDSYRIANRDDAEMTASGSVDLVLDDGAPTLKVDMLVDEAEFAPVGLAGSDGSATPTLDVVEINRPAYLAPPPERQAGPSLTLDARVRANRRVFVRAPGLESEWSFDVRVEGEADAASVNGSATLMRGEFDLAGEGFDFDQGTITFRGDVDSARLDLTARRDASDLTARLRVTGALAEPEIALESTPSFPEDEILARVLFDRSASELTALEAAQLAAALAQLARGGFGVADILRQELGLDRLRVAGDAEGGAIVTGGKYIADGVYLEVGARGEGGAVAAIEWEIRPRLELVSRFSDADEAEIALRWRRDY